MSLVGERREYCDKEEQEEEEQEQEEGEVMMTSKLPFSSPSSSSSSPIKYKKLISEQHNLWPPAGSFDYQSQQNKRQELPSANFDKQLEFMDLSLGNNSNNETDHSSSGAPAGASAEPILIGREHMFDKVVTPSDVGKLNRLVIPKQHAEKYFPLDSSSTEKGLLLSFEDRNGKPWRFRYSYWNSSQSYVMTKGWSRFVKEKKLDAGDIVSFQRGVGESGKHRLFIDWRRRQNAAPDPTSFPDLQNQLINYPQSVRWGRLPQSNLSMPTLQYHHHPQPAQFHHLNYSIRPYHHQQHQLTTMTTSFGNATPYHFRPAGGLQIGGMHHQQRIRGHHVPLVIDSVPVVHGKTTGKRLRLFGVNMEYSPPSPPPLQDESQIAHGATVDSFSPHNLASSSLPPLQLRVPTTSAPMPTMQAAEFSKKGKTTSLSFDLDL